MRIAFLAYRGSMTSGGQGIYLYALTRELARRGHEIECLVGPPFPDPMHWARVSHVENQHFWGSRFDKRPGAFLPRPNPFRIFRPLNFWEYAVSRFGFLPEPFAFSVRAASAVIERLRRGARYDVVHDVQSIGYGLLWLRALGLPVVTTVHHPLTVDRAFSLRRDRTFTERKGTLTFYPVRTQARVARRLDGVITSSHASSAEIQRGFGVSPARIHVIGNGVELPRPGRPRPAPAESRLLFLGRCGDPNKGLEHLLVALSLLPPSVHLDVLDKSPEGTPLGALVHRLGVGDRIRFVGKLSADALDAAYRSAAIVVVPSLFEGFGLPAIEALAVGTPVVASRAGALPEVVSLAGAGKLVPPADPPGLAKAISDVLQDWEREHARALGARARIEAEFSWTEIARRTEAVYEQARLGAAG
jgi:glycosyltransferase involved in cell wall biosynthesis